MGAGLRGYLEPIASWFAQFNLPENIVHWELKGIPIRIEIGPKDIEQQHAKVAPLMYLFIVMGASGGILSLVMQGEPILESPHFWTGMGAIALLTTNAVIAATKFGRGNQTLRSTHAYVGSAAVALLVVHAVLGTRLGLSF